MLGKIAISVKNIEIIQPKEANDGDSRQRSSSRVDGKLERRSNTSTGVECSRQAEHLEAK